MLGLLPIVLAAMEKVRVVSMTKHGPETKAKVIVIDSEQLKLKFVITLQASSLWNGLMRWTKVSR